MSDKLQKAFEYVRDTYFPGWDQKREWKVKNCSEELAGRGLDGECVNKTKTIKINMTCDYLYDALHCLLIHEICHCDGNDHDEIWQNVMFKIAKMAEQNGYIKLSEMIKRDVDNGIIVDEYHKRMLEVKMYGIVKKCVDECPDIPSNELMTKLIGEYGVPADIPEKWINICKRQYDYIKRRTMSSHCKHGLKQDQCSYCTQNTVPKGGAIPQFTTRVYQFRGYPVLEILVNGQPWGVTFPFDAHFRFGVKRARLILVFNNLIKQFVETDGRLPIFNTQIKRTDSKYNLNSPCTCTTFPNFNLANGLPINSPYMKLRSGTVAIGFGLIKAEALIKVQSDIEKFA